jgi:hypothetical protein
MWVSCAARTNVINAINDNSARNEKKMRNSTKTNPTKEEKEKKEMGARRLNNVLTISI